MEEMQTVVVTGGGKGIGASISQVFHGAGYSVVIGSRTDSGLAAGLGDRAQFHATDVQKPQDTAGLVQAALDSTGRLDVMVNNSGYSEWKSVADADEAFWDRMVDTNLKGVFFGCKAAAAELGE